jgi:putative ABC transport system permease protein
VAERMKYKVGDRITLSHGTGEFGAQHSDKPFTVVGVLGRTGTPVDRSIHVSLESMEAIHLDWQGGMRIPGLSIPPQLVKKFDLAPKEITAALIGLKSRAPRVPGATDDQQLCRRGASGRAPRRRAE